MRVSTGSCVKWRSVVCVAWLVICLFYFTQRLNLMGFVNNTFRPLIYRTISIGIRLLDDPSQLIIFRLSGRREFIDEVKPRL